MLGCNNYSVVNIKHAVDKLWQGRRLFIESVAGDCEDILNTIIRV